MAVKCSRKEMWTKLSPWRGEKKKKKKKLKKLITVENSLSQRTSPEKLQT